ncbi:hypothetical protein D3C87_366090 [compost metagenome]
MVPRTRALAVSSTFRPRPRTWISRPVRLRFRPICGPRGLASVSTGSPPGRLISTTSIFTTPFDPGRLGEMFASSMLRSPLSWMLPSDPRTAVSTPLARASAMSLSMTRKRVSSIRRVEPDPSRRPRFPLPATVPLIPSVASKRSITAWAPSNRLARVMLSSRSPVALSRKAPWVRSMRPFTRGSFREPAREARAATWPDSDCAPPRKRSQMGWIWPLTAIWPDMSRVRAMARRKGAAEASTGRLTSAEA